MTLKVLESRIDAHVAALSARAIATGVFDPDTAETDDLVNGVMVYLLDSAVMEYLDEEAFLAVYSIACYASNRVRARDIFERLAKRMGAAGWDVAATGEGALGDGDWWGFAGSVTGDAASQ